MFLKNIKSRTQILFLIILFMAIIFTTQGEAVDNGNSLWRKAVRNSVLTGKIYPARLVEKETIFNSDGNIEETTGTIIKVHNKNGNLKCRLVSAKKNKKDLTGKEYDEVKQFILHITRKDILSSEILLFSKSNQTNINFSLKRKSVKVGSRICSEYSFKQKTGNNVWNGTAWIEEKTGRPIKIRTRPERIIDDENKLKISSLYMIVHFGTVLGKYWHPNKVTVISNFVYRPLPFVSFKGKSQETTLYENFRKF